MTGLTTLSDTEQAAWDAYLAAGQPPICPRCGAWDGPPLPSCARPNGHDGRICAQTFWADDVCDGCAEDMRREDRR